MAISRQLLNRFRDRLIADRKALIALSTEHNPSTERLTARLHKLAGASAQIGFGTLGNTLKALEAQARFQSPSASAVAALALQASSAILQAEEDFDDRAILPEMAETSPEISLSDLKVLVIEDDAEVCALCRSALMAMGIKNIETALTVHAASGLLESYAPSAVICDWRLDRGTGLDVLRTIRAGGYRDLEDVPFIMLTGVRDLKSVKKALEEGVDDFVVKPFAPTRLKAAVLRAADSLVSGPKRDEPIDALEL